MKKKYMVKVYRTFIVEANDENEARLLAKGRLRDNPVDVFTEIGDQ